MSESDIHYALTEAISSARAQNDVSAIWTGVKRLPREIPSSPEWNWLTRPLFSHHTMRVQHADQANSQGGAQSMAERLATSKTHQEAFLIIQEFFLVELARMLNLQHDLLGSNNDLTSLGVDSLSASDIRAWFLKELDVDVSILKILGGSTIRDRMDSLSATLEDYANLKFSSL